VFTLTATMVCVSGQEDPVDNSTFSILQTSDQQFKLCQLVAISLRHFVTTAACAQSLVINASSYSIEVAPVVPLSEEAVPWAGKLGKILKTRLEIFSTFLLVYRKLDDRKSFRTSELHQQQEDAQ
jgi:hypothetical protein